MNLFTNSIFPLRAESPRFDSRAAKPPCYQNEVNQQDSKMNGVSMFQQFHFISMFRLLGCGRHSKQSCDNDAETLYVILGLKNWNLSVVQ